MTASAFWTCVGLILYHHMGYPLALRVVAAIRRRFGTACLTPPEALSPLRSVTLVVPAHNEALVIAAKVANLAALDYPRDLLAVVLALDGCTDGTAAIARSAIAQAGRPEFRLVEYPSNIGKVAVLNDQIALAGTDIVALSDASALLAPDALARAVSHFGKPNVGVVCPTYGLVRSGSEGERAYWDYQTRVKADEGAVGAPMGAHGAFYLFRRRLWSPLPPDTINDDFVLPMRILLAGCDVVYDASIVATELETSTPRQDFRRRIRIGAGNLQQVVRLPGLLDPRRPGVAFVFVSGKALRAFMPVFVFVALATVPLLAAQGGIYTAILIFESSCIIAAAMGMVVKNVKLPRVVSWPAYVIHGYAAALLGALILLTGFKGRVWQFSSAAKARKGASAGK
jgi:cellulose synthase/poly-beta-1,6-N-acetylglucosamine synthase-like glycosyltransferase